MDIFYENIVLMGLITYNNWIWFYLAGEITLKFITSEQWMLSEFIYKTRK